MRSPAKTDPRPVLLVDLSLVYGGIQTRILHLARALQDRRPVFIAVLSGSPLHGEMAARGLPCLALGYRRSNPLHIWRLYRFICSNGIVVVDSQNPQSHLWGHLAARLAGVPARLATVHSIYRGTASAGPAREWRHELSLHIARRLGARFVAVSQPIRDYLVSTGVPTERTRLVANAVMPAADAVGAPHAGIREACGWNADDFVVVVPARLDPVKGHRLLIEAADRLRGVEPVLRYAFVGDGAERAALEAEVRRRKLDDIVRFLGFRTDVQALLGGCDLMCLPSLSEGLPFALLEAVGVGVPVLVSDIAAYRGLLDHGRTARLFPVHDVEGLCAELRWCTGHPDELGAMAHTAAEALRPRFSVDGLIDRMLAVYESAAATA